MGDKYLDFFTPETLFNSIAWQVECGHKPTQEDLKQLIRYYRCGEIYVKRGRGRPSNYPEQFRIAKAVVRKIAELHSRDKAIKAVCRDMSKGEKRVGEIYDKEKDHATAVVQREDIIQRIDELAKDQDIDSAIQQVAAEDGQSSDEIEFVYHQYKGLLPTD